MLDGRDAGAGGVAECGAKRRLRYIRALGLELTLAAARQPRAQKGDAGVYASGMKDDLSRRR